MSLIQLPELLIYFLPITQGVLFDSIIIEGAKVALASAGPALRQQMLR